MRVLVNKIEKDVLIKLLPLFGLDSQIAVLDDAAPTDSMGKGVRVKEPYYIEENIADLNKVLAICDDVDHDRTPIRKQTDWDDFCDFWQLMTEIEKQREFEEPLSNIEYIFRKGLNCGFSISLTPAVAEMGFRPDCKYDVIVGKSELGVMMLYQEAGDFLEYVFSLEYTRIKRFSKKPVRDFTHWHPRGYNDAIADMTAFMTNDREYFKRTIRINL